MCAGDCAGDSPVLWNLPVPSVTSISPASATAGGSQFLLTVNGDDFRQDSGVKWNGSFLVTSFVNSQQLIAAVTVADIAQPGTVLVFVFNPPEGGTTFVCVLSASMHDLRGSAW